MLPCIAARRRSRAAREAGGISRADFRTTLLAADLFGISFPLDRFRRTRTNDSCNLGVLRPSTLIRRPTWPGPNLIGSNALEAVHRAALFSNPIGEEGGASRAVHFTVATRAPSL